MLSAPGWTCRTSHGAVISLHRGRRARRRFPTWQFDSVRRALHRVMQQRVQLQCCTRGRFRPAHPRQLAGLRMRDLPARRFVCARCRAPVLVCSHCDRGQIYCAAGCAAMARRQSQREAGQRYQDSLPGRFKHAARSRCWRQRKAALAISSVPPATSVAPCAAQSVTHQGSPTSASDAVLTVSSLMPAAAAAPAPAAPVQPCRAVTITTSNTSTATTPASSAAVAGLPNTLPTRCCHWCRTPCSARVRLDFLRHSRAARRAHRARARVEPSHGHSP